MLVQPASSLETQYSPTGSKTDVPGHFCNSKSQYKTVGKIIYGCPVWSKQHLFISNIVYTQVIRWIALFSYQIRTFKNYVAPRYLKRDVKHFMFYTRSCWETASRVGAFKIGPLGATGQLNFRAIFGLRVEHEVIWAHLIHLLRSLTTVDEWNKLHAHLNVGRPTYASLGNSNQFFKHYNIDINLVLVKTITDNILGRTSPE